MFLVLFVVLLLSLQLVSTNQYLSQSDYLEQESGINPHYMKEFLFLVEHKAFYRGQVHFFGSYLDDTQARWMELELMKMGWSARWMRVRVIEAVRASDVVSYDGEHGMCKILKTGSGSDNAMNYRSVINLRSNPYTKHEMFAIPPDPGFWFYSCHHENWFINVIELDMNLFTPQNKTKKGCTSPDETLCTPDSEKSQ